MITKMAPTKADLNIISINCNGYKANSLYTDKLTKSYDCIHSLPTDMNLVDHSEELHYF